MKLNTINGAALMSQPLRPPNFVVDSLLAQGLHILAGSPKVGKSWLAPPRWASPGWPCGWR